MSSAQRLSSSVQCVALQWQSGSGCGGAARAPFTAKQSCAAPYAAGQWRPVEGKYPLAEPRGQTPSPVAVKSPPRGSQSVSIPSKMCPCLARLAGHQSIINIVVSPMQCQCRALSRNIGPWACFLSLVSQAKLSIRLDCALALPRCYSEMRMIWPRQPENEGSCGSQINERLESCPYTSSDKCFDSLQLLRGSGLLDRWVLFRPA